MKSTPRHPTLDEIEEAADAIRQRNRLYGVRELLSDNEAASDLLEAIDVAIEDIGDWIDPEIEVAFGQEELRPDRLPD